MCDSVLLLHSCSPPFFSITGGGGRRQPCSSRQHGSLDTGAALSSAEAQAGTPGCRQLQGCIRERRQQQHQARSGRQRQVRQCAHLVRLRLGLIALFKLCEFRGSIGLLGPIGIMQKGSCFLLLHGHPYKCCQHPSRLFHKTHCAVTGVVSAVILFCFHCTFCPRSNDVTCYVSACQVQ